MSFAVRVTRKWLDVGLPSARAAGKWRRAFKRLPRRILRELGNFP